MSEATATTEEISDVVLHFGVDPMPANSALLRLASPVFNRMLASGMKEAQQGVIEVDVASKKEFITFYNLLGPWAWSRDKVTEANVDSLLAISDYYQVEIIKQTCEDLLLTLPPSGARLLQAKKHGLNRQYLRCVDAVAKSRTQENLEMLRQAEPDIILDVALKMQHMLNQLMGMKPEIIICNTAQPRYYSEDEEVAYMLKSEADQLKSLHGKLLDLVQELESPPQVPPRVRWMMRWLQRTGVWWLLRGLRTVVTRVADGVVAAYRSCMCVLWWLLTRISSVLREEYREVLQCGALACFFIFLRQFSRNLDT
ncbi:unnamed protein product [Symbiodinium sp. CCMP2456]|nr:unnamed protein product [Symbiodinium sp. CCMP2456]